ncbi:ABC transporter permease [Cellvibrio japonicus]|uniref:Efflux ABC transporter, permease protein n=1 Tax=Cellvibrio japonicus (strain Ueda107) TaxID=498211 RepID=B3PEQ1_CELJU|nr:ABC transporter permease [Cellvibrio japonicus]ACE83173.1 efflux ABC transporter, permease protein [Cellvibrio japonicus Ueda107]QEI10790.1 FtsX-like permease family protein [Cellvibrio japonicus]QEI14366.1 FtsX-like permease family protein [Cellvibrio japonicus]QEI17944.1 FtsX-like permease family protein [Cellvibrio japonicus]
MDSLQEILYTLRQNKLRTALTAFGVFWGIFMLVLLLGAGRGMQNGIYADFGSDVLDFVAVWSGTTSVAYQGRGLGRQISLTLDDVEALQRQIKGIRVISPESMRGGISVVYDTKSGNFPVYGVPDDYFNVKESIPFEQGRKTNQLDEQQIRKVVTLGRTVSERLFGPGVSPVGKTVRINDVAMTVVGVFYDKGNRGRDSERVYIPASTFQKLFGSGHFIGSIWLRPQAGVDSFAFEQQVVELLKRRHQVSPDDRRAIRSFNMAEPAARVNGLFIGINGFIWFVGLGTLMAGIVGVSNIMIITVKERTREIGIRKALGATPFSIISTLLFESIMVTGIAGYAGLVVGVGLIELIAYGLNSVGAQMPFFKNPEIDFQVAFTAVVLLVIVGALAGLMPALRAAKIMPIEAMRAD